jgi:hypothetical protein
MKDNNLSAYQYMDSVLCELEIDEATMIPWPLNNVSLHRKYMRDIGLRDGKKFVTKKVGDKMWIMRVPYISKVDQQKAANRVD